MINTKDTLKEEVKYRISLLELEMEKELRKPKDDENMYWFFTQEHLNYSEFLKMVEHFERIDFKNEIDKEKYTPFKCEETGTPLLIGDYVEIDRGDKYGKGNTKCGVLIWEEFYNEYRLVRYKEDGTKEAGATKINGKKLYKIEELYDYEIDTTRCETRTSSIRRNKDWRGNLI